MSRPGLPLFSNFLLYREVTLRVPSALMSLTSVFGMGTGVSSLLSSLYNDLTRKLVFAGRSDVELFQIFDLSKLRPVNYKFRLVF